MVTMVTWLTVVEIMLIIGMASLSWWWWKKRQMKMSSVKVKLAESASAVRIECQIGAPYQDRLDQDAVEQSTVAVRDLGPEKSLTRPVVKTRSVVRHGCRKNIHIWSLKEKKGSLKKWVFNFEKKEKSVEKKGEKWVFNFEKKEKSVEKRRKMSV